MQPPYFYLGQSYQTRLLRRVPKSQHDWSHKIPQPKPCYSQRPHEWPRMGIRSTRQNEIHANVIPPVPDNPCNSDSISIDHSSVSPVPQRPSNANIIKTEDVSSKANIFCFAAFADKRTGILYNDLTGTFPFMSLEGNECFFVVYHYKTNAILALPIKGFSNDIIFAAYQQQYNMLKAKGNKIKLNMMDNQATKVTKKFLDIKQCNLLLVESHNH
jgi:hypothetical protein